LICSGVWGLFSLIALIAWLRWQGDHSSARDVPTAELLGLLSHTQAVNERPLSAAAAWGIVDAPVARPPIALRLPKTRHMPVVRKWKCMAELPQRRNRTSGRGWVSAVPFWYKSYSAAFVSRRGLSPW
jgi:hypothetical protein